MWHRILQSIQHNARQMRWVFRIAHAKRVRQRWVQSVANNAGPDAGREAGLKPSHAAKTCLLDIHRITFDGEQGRRFHALVSMLARGGYQVYLMPHLSFLQSGQKQFKWSALCTILPYCEKTSPDKFSICLSDRSVDHPLAMRTLKLSAATGRAVRDGEIPMPYSHYPPLSDLAEDKRFDEYRQKPRKWRLFFGGNCQVDAYRRIGKYKRLKPIDRHSLLQITLDHFRASTTRIPDNDHFEHHATMQDDGFVVIDSNDYRITPDRWLGAISNAAFLLAAPGCDYPLSHNCIEAMAVGTIPVLQYDTLFYPPLEDGVNCVAFRDRQGFVDALQRIEAMSEREIQTIRDGTIEYYRNHLSSESFCEKIQSDQYDSMHMFPYLAKAGKRNGDGSLMASRVRR